MNVNTRYFTYTKKLVLAVSVISMGVFLVASTPFFALFRPEFDTTLTPEHKTFVYEKMIEAFRRNGNSCDSKEGYCKRPETQHVDCGRILRGDKAHLQTLTGPSRIPLIPDPYLNMSCSAIKNRIHPDHLNFKPLKLGGIGFARIVYKDYEFLEKQLQVSYHPQNLFCYTIDEKSSEEFQQRVKRLQECLPNVIVLPATVSYDSSGHNYSSAYYRCMKALINIPGWSYLMLLQNHDVFTKSVYEMDRIFELLDGANDVSVTKETEGRRKNHLKWDPISLKMFRNDSGIEESILSSEMRISSGYSQASMSRAAVDWMVNTVDLTVFIDQWNQTDYGGDEQFLSSLQVNPEFRMPGHFTDECIRQKAPVNSVTRMTQWAFGDPNKCATKTVRNEICVFGIEDLKALAESTSMVFNKMIPSFDYSIVECTAELIYNRTFLGQVDKILDEEFYENRVYVQYHKHHKEPGYTINCTYDNGPWKYKNYL